MFLPFPLIMLVRYLSRMSAASASQNGLTIVQEVLSNAFQIPSNSPSGQIALQGRQYEGCTIVVPAATWLPPSYTACIVQQTAIPCDAPYPTPTCPQASSALQTHAPTPITDSRQTQSQSDESQSHGQSNASSDASIDFSQGNGGSGGQNTAVIIGVTIGAVVLLILIIILGLFAVRRRCPRRKGTEIRHPSNGKGSGRGDRGGPHRRTRARLEDANISEEDVGRLGPEQPEVGPTNGSSPLNPPLDPRPNRPMPGDWVSSPSASTDSSARRGMTAAHRVGDHPRAAFPSQSLPTDGRQHSTNRRSRSRYRQGDHGEHPENDLLFSPGARQERKRRREQRQARGVTSDDEHLPLARVERETSTVPLPSLSVQGATAKDQISDDIQSPETSRWGPGKHYIPHGSRKAEDDGDEV